MKNILSYFCLVKEYTQSINFFKGKVSTKSKYFECRRKYFSIIFLFSFSLSILLNCIDIFVFLFRLTCTLYLTRIFLTIWFYSPFVQGTGSQWITLLITYVWQIRDFQSAVLLTLYHLLILRNKSFDVPKCSLNSIFVSPKTTHVRSIYAHIAHTTRIRY